VPDIDEQGPGLDAIRAHVNGADGGPPRHQRFPRHPSRFQRGGPVHAVSVHAIEQPPHWHLVTCGLSELFTKESADPTVSGWGFELTLRLRRDDDELPAWACDLLTTLAAHVWQTGHDFAYGDHVDLRGPIRLDRDTAITAAAVAVDPGLVGLSGPFGRVEFLQLVGLTADELELCRAWQTADVLGLLTAADPLLITDLSRRSLLDDPAVRELAEAGIAAQGPSVDELRIATMRWIRHRARVVVQLGAGAATALGPALRRKLNRPGASFRVVGDAGEMRFVVAGSARWALSPDRLLIEVPAAAVDGLADVFAGVPGSRALADLPGLRFVVLP
jgi:suppressor of fused-like protein